MHFIHYFFAFLAAITRIQFVSSEPISLSPISLGSVLIFAKKNKDSELRARSLSHVTDWFNGRVVLDGRESMCISDYCYCTFAKTNALTILLSLHISPFSVGIRIWIRKNDLARTFNSPFYFTTLVALIFSKCNKHFAGTSYLSSLTLEFAKFSLSKERVWLDATFIG